MEPEVVGFMVPIECDKTVFVWNIAARRAEGNIYCCLLNVFSEFGPLYSLKLLPNAGVSEPGYYAVIKYYLSRCARRAQEACNRKSLFQDSPLKVQVCSKQKGFPYKSLMLNSNKCQDLANYYLGFTGWSKRIIALQNISGLEETDDACDAQEPRKMRYLCVLEVMIPAHDVCSRGIGIAEEDLEKSNDPMEFLMKSGKLQKYAVQRALSEAFQKILLVVFESGKVAVEYVAPDNDPVDCLSEEELQGLIQINDFTWAQTNANGEEENLSDLTFYEETMAEDLMSNA